MSDLIHWLTTTRTKEDLAKEVASQAHTIAKLRDRVVKLEVENFWLKAKDSRYKDQRDELLKFVKSAPVGSGVCCCGAAMEDHPFDDHQPTDMWDYSISQMEKKFKEEENNVPQT